jgi:Zn-dependent peptidase ImmA (M78 family)
MTSGDPSVLAFRLAFTPDPDGDRDRATTEDSASWGSFALWAGGENLCAHLEQGEMMHAAHWYMLPLMEWLAERWDPLLHEERLPLRNAGTSAAESLAQTRLPPISLKELDEFEWLSTWSGWWHRHSVRAAREGGLFPDIYLRRYRDRLEVSTGAEPLPGVPQDFAFLALNRSYLADLTGASQAIWQVLSAATQELRRRLPDSARIEALANRVALLTDPTAEEGRIAWLSGAGDRFPRISRAVRETLASASEQVRAGILATRPDSRLAVVGSPYARLLYGAASPTTTTDDVVTLTRHVIDNYAPDSADWLSGLELPLDADEVRHLSPGEQGGRLGERACALLAGNSAGWVDIESVTADLGISISDIDLSDPELRAVTVFGETQRPHVFCNTRTRWARSPSARRFTVAHELCHLLLDREHGDELAIASGPWAPRAIEQRAGAFAAAFLMPTWLLRDALSMASAAADDPETIRSVSGQLRVSVSSLVDRLYNLGEITVEDRDQLRGRLAS